MSLTALISHITRGSFHDGAGIRTVVYFMGCGLRCKWCHNPETFKAERVVMHLPARCMHCGSCVEVCPQHHVIEGNDMRLLREGCALCGRCTDACPTGALSLCGKSMTVDEVLAVIRKDKHYYDESGGGVTLSGGECLLQSAFCAELLRRCREEGIHTTVESALYVSWEAVEAVLPYLDHLFADMKLPDGERHKAWTGRDNTLILSNLSRIIAKGQSVTVRIPLIPTVNDSPEDMDAFAAVMAEIGVTDVELLRYNYLAEGKYDSVGLAYTSFGKAAQSDEVMASLAEQLMKRIPTLRVTYR
ncbi:MAG: glycyl-radical enzyme activating protein [Clostridia bacterium]|nr:glycyl-radical enzyme activating protein [Clostridia bacterium]